MFHSPWIHTMLRCALTALLSLTLALPALAQTSRPFPATALRGTLVVTQPPEAVLNEQSARLSPGSRIRGPNNMVLMSGALVGQALLVHYTLDPTGLVHDVWILTPDEIAKKPWPSTAEQARAWVFSPMTQTWAKP